MKATASASWSHDSKNAYLSQFHDRSRAAKGGPGVWTALMVKKLIKIAFFLKPFFFTFMLGDPPPPGHRSGYATARSHTHELITHFICYGTRWIHVNFFNGKNIAISRQNLSNRELYLRSTHMEATRQTGFFFFRNYEGPRG